MDVERTLSRLTIADEAFVESLLPGDANLAASALDPKCHALVRLAALIAVDAAPASYLCAVESARAAGATDEELVGCLVSVISVLGAARVIDAAPKVGLALGYDVAAALEESALPSAVAIERGGGARDSHSRRRRFRASGHPEP